MNLHAAVSGAIGAVNPPILVTIKRSTGYTVDASYQQVPSYMTFTGIVAQVQPLTWRDLQQIDGLNLQGTRKAIYVNGSVDGVVRVTLKGGDLVTFPDGSVWLVAQVLEGFDLTAGWTKAAITLQDGA